MIATTTFGETAESVLPAAASAALPDFSLVAGGPPTLHRAKRAGKSAYGTLSQRYTSGFEQKWMSGATRDEQLLGTSDIQSLADLRNGYDVVRTMRLLPIGRDTVLRLLIFPLIPVAPLALTLVPLDRLMKELISALF